MTRFIKFACGMMVSLALRSCRPMVVISLGFWFDFREDDIPCDIVSDWQNIQIWIITIIITILIFPTFQQWWLFPWSARSSWRARGWDSTFPLLSDQRSPPSDFHHQLSFFIFQHKCLHLLVIGDIQVEVLKHAGQLWPILGGVPIKLDLSYVTRLCISSYIRLSNVKIIKYQAWSHP